MSMPIDVYQDTIRESSRTHTTVHEGNHRTRMRETGRMINNDNYALKVRPSTLKKNCKEI